MNIGDWRRSCDYEAPARLTATFGGNDLIALMEIALDDLASRMRLGKSGS